jgi:uncharacterized membrane protein (DUF485 family)
MGGIEEHAVAHVETETEDTIARNARIGLYLFGVYVLFYAGFMVLSAFAPEIMARRPFGGLNLALIYGFGLIALAWVLAIIYMVFCRRRKGANTPKEGGR